MTALELLAPARNKETGVAAINCGADAVYIAGPDFGARKDAGNPVEDIAELCSYAHQFGARVFVTFNTTIRDGEEDSAHRQMLQAQEAGADAFIIRDERICGWEDIHVPLHASTQCAIRDVERARHFERLGCARIILERELSLETIRKICKAVSCEVECFVHGALCVCYSGDCRLSEKINGRSADRGECIQACRSLYDLYDVQGKLLLRNKALLSLKDFNLKDRMEDLADAGVVSFKIEGRLKNESYVKNVTREYSLELDRIVACNPDKFRRASFGKVESSFTPDSGKTFNRGYTELYLDGKRGQWSSMDAPKSMGEAIGIISRIRKIDRYSLELSLKPFRKNLELNNGDGFAFSSGEGVTGFRGDVCKGLTISCKAVPGLEEGLTIYRNINSAFEKSLEADRTKRMIDVSLKVHIHGKFNIDVTAHSEDGRELTCPFNTDLETAQNRERAEAMLTEQLSKRSGVFSFHVDEIMAGTPGKVLPLLSASTINSIRRLVAEDLAMIPCNRIPLHSASNKDADEPRLPSIISPENELMRSKYCVRHELGMCPKQGSAKDSSPLFLQNNGRRFKLCFDCRNCEMVLTQD